MPNFISIFAEKTYKSMAAKTLATVLQKENFKTNFADIVKDNDTLRGKYTIQFFDTAVKSNYVINGLNGKSINVLSMLTMEESDRYRALKNHWQD